MAKKNLIEDASNYYESVIPKYLIAFGVNFEYIDFDWEGEPLSFTLFITEFESEDDDADFEDDAEKLAQFLNAQNLSFGNIKFIHFGRSNNVRVDMVRSKIVPVSADSKAKIRQQKMEKLFKGQDYRLLIFFGAGCAIIFMVLMAVMKQFAYLGIFWQSWGGGVAVGLGVTGIILALLLGSPKIGESVLFWISLGFYAIYSLFLMDLFLFFAFTVYWTLLTAIYGSIQAWIMKTKK